MWNFLFHRLMLNFRTCAQMFRAASTESLPTRLLQKRLQSFLAEWMHDSHGSKNGHRQKQWSDELLEGAPTPSNYKPPYSTTLCHLVLLLTHSLTHSLSHTHAYIFLKEIREPAGWLLSAPQQTNVNPVYVHMCVSCLPRPEHSHYFFFFYPNPP